MRSWERAGERRVSLGGGRTAPPKKDRSVTEVEVAGARSRGYSRLVGTAKRLERPRLLVDESQWPILRVRFPAQLTEATAIAFAELVHSKLEADEDFALLVDLLNTRGVQVPAIRHLRRFAQAHGPRLDRRLISLSAAVPSAMIRGAMKLVFSFRSPAHDHAWFGTLEHAERHVEAVIRRPANSATYAGDT